MTDIVPNPDLLIAESASHTPEIEREITFTTRQVTPEDEDLWLQMGQLRAAVYLRKKYITEEALDENGAEFDKYDSRSDHFVAVSDEGKVIGTVRVINRGGDNQPLPAEDEFLTLLPEKVQEISRLLHDKMPSSEGMLVSLALMRAALKATQGRSETIYAVLEDRLHRELSEHIGIGLTKIGNPMIIEHYNGTKNHLVEMQPRYITSQIHSRDMRMRTEEEAREKPRGSILDKPFAPFFERANATNGLGRVSLSDLGAPNPAQFERNRGFYSAEEQEKLWRSTVAIAGAGGDGGQLALTLARAGVLNFKLADPEVFGVENLNRQAGGSYETIGQNKAMVLAKELRALGATVEVFPIGINEDNIGTFVDGSDLVIDETEFTMPQLGVMIARESRGKNVPVLMTLNIGFGSYTTSFDPKGMTFEEYLGIDPNLTLEEIAQQAEAPDYSIPISKWAPHIPSYANVEVLKQVVSGEISAPTVAQGVQFAAGDAGTKAVAHLLSGINPDWDKWISWAPHGRTIDAKDGSSEVKSRSLRFSSTVAIAALRTKFGKSHPKQPKPPKRTA